MRRLQEVIDWTSRLEDSQDWLMTRFAGLAPGDFGISLQFITVAPLLSPPGFSTVWSTLAEGNALLPLSNRDAGAAVYEGIVLLCDPAQPDQLELLRQFLPSRQYEDAPMMLLPHSVRQAGHGVQQHFGEDLLSELMAAGIDAVMRGEPASFEVVLAVRAQVALEFELAKRVGRSVVERWESHMYLKGCHDQTLWDYLRYRLAPLLPELDLNVSESGLPLELAKHYTFGETLGAGSCGTVRMLLPRDLCSGDEDDNEPQALKMLKKDKYTRAEHIIVLQRQMSVMQHLSADENEHPNIVRILGIYHTPEFICLRMEFGGWLDLRGWLVQRDAAGNSTRPPSTVATQSLIIQSAAAVSHLHANQISHRDLKPKNFIVDTEQEEVPLMKLADFDLSLQADVDGFVCRHRCGTFPFLAPEVLLSEAYDPFAADVWSLGVVMLELLCGVEVLERSLSLPPQREIRESLQTMMDIRDFFLRSDATASLLSANCREDARELLHDHSAIFGQMLTVEPLGRLKAEDIMTAVSRST